MTSQHENTPEDTPTDTPADAAAAGAAADAAQAPAGQQPLSGNDAVNLASEQSKSTAHRNIPSLDLGDIPVPDDTANLRHGPNLHDGLLALLPLVGVWRGEGQSSTPAGDYAFGQQIVFAHDGENYLTYDSRIWRFDEEGNPAGAEVRESGFWRISLTDDIEFVCTHSTGVAEIFYGEPVNDRAWQIESASTMVTSSCTTELGPGKRLYGLLPNNDLGWVDERLINGEMHPRMSAQLKRIAG